MNEIEQVGPSEEAEPLSERPAPAGSVDGATATDSAAPPAAIRVFLEEAGFLPDRKGGVQLAGKGWAVAPSKIAAIGIYLDDTLVGYATYGLSRPDIAQAFPGYKHADHSGFEFAVSELPRLGKDELQLVLTARSESGESKSATEIIAVDPALAHEASLQEAGPVEVSARPLPLRLHIDDISIDEKGILYVEGWAISLVGSPRIEVAVDEVDIGCAEVGRVREDVAHTWPQYSNARFSGFLLIAQLNVDSPGTRMIRVRAQASGGIRREISVPVAASGGSDASASAPTRLLRVEIDTIALSTTGRIVVAGWAVCHDKVDVMVVQLDGAPIGEARIDLPRPDVGNQFPALPHARQSGFSFRGRVDGEWEGEHFLALELHTRVGETKEILLPVCALEEADTDVVEILPPPAPEEEALRLALDAPALIGGIAVEPVKGSLTINGWALATQGVALIDISIDGVYATSAYYGVRREDIAAAFPNRENALLSGFAAVIPARRLTMGKRVIAITLRDKNEQTKSLDFIIDVGELSDEPGPWLLRSKIPEAENQLYRRILGGLLWTPSFNFLLRFTPGHDDIDTVRTTLGSVVRQGYAKWRLVVWVSDPHPIPDRLAVRLLEGFEETRDRVHVVSQSSIGPLPAPASRPIVETSPSYYSLLAAGDEISPNFLFEFAIHSGIHRVADFIYCDERRTSPITNVFDAFFKPEWSPDLLLSTNYIGRSWCAREDVLQRLPLALRELIGLGDYEAALRCTETAGSIRHIPIVLLQRPAEDCSRDDDDRRALEAAIVRRGISGEVRSGCVPGTFELRRTTKVEGLVSIIIPTCAARGLIKTCLDSLRDKTAYRDFEIICIENIADRDADWRDWLKTHADVVISTTEPFNWSRFNNIAAEKASGEFLLFLNDDIEIIEADWLDRLLEHAVRPEVGVVGPQLLYPDRRVQHAGLFLTRLGTARHAFRFAAEDEPGYFGLALTQRNVIGVTGACLLTRRSVFDAVGRFDEVHTVVNNDLDFCLRIWRQGLLAIFTPYAKLIHHELASRSGLDDNYDSTAFDNEWRSVFLHGDPYFHPRLSMDFDDYTLDREPVDVVCAGHPVFAKEAVRNVLVVKLDHIGDCVTALPAVRRLKRHFPEAKIHVLAAPSTRAVWATEPVVDSLIDFTLFHTQSGLGMKELGADDLQQLRDRLAPYRFDLAVDLRKSPDSRHILQYSGASIVAGFDTNARFPWLDVALQWEGDPKFTPKRHHVADDLINLVAAIETACDSDRIVMARPAGGVPENLELDALCRKRVVCIHPAAGTEMRQWPRAYFSQLIDLLIEEEDVHIALIGGPDEDEIAADVLLRVRHVQSVWSLLGKLKLNELPRLLTACALFVGNNSGPKHLAAGLGVPTVGIHSGVIDSREWGPLGPNAVALRRNMSCSPCYLAKLEQCHRDLACMKTLLPGDVFRVCRNLLAIGQEVPWKQPADDATPGSRPEHPGDR